MPSLKFVEQADPIEPVPSRSQRHALATGREQSVESPALVLQELLQTAMTQPEAPTARPGKIAVVVVVGLGIVCLCLVFWTAAVSAFLSAVT